MAFSKYGLNMVKIKGEIIVNPHVIWPVCTLPTRSLKLSTIPLEITSIRAPLPNSVKNMGKYIILLSFYVSLLPKQKILLKNKRRKI